MSNHRCIFGEGCQGVLDADATDMMQGCCSYGAHFVDDDDVQTVVRAFINVEPSTHAVLRNCSGEGLS